MSVHHDCSSAPRLNSVIPALHVQIDLGCIIIIVVVSIIVVLVGDDGGGGCYCRCGHSEQPLIITANLPASAHKFGKHSRLHEMFHAPSLSHTHNIPTPQQRRCFSSSPALFLPFQCDEAFK